jgi:hypothetical protein
LRNINADIGEKLLVFGWPTSQNATGSPPGDLLSWCCLLWLCVSAASSSIFEPSWSDILTRKLRIEEF